MSLACRRENGLEAFVDGDVEVANHASFAADGSRGVAQWVNEFCNHGVRISPSTGPPVGESVAVAMAGTVAMAEIIERGQLVIEPLLDDPMPDYDSNPPLWQA